MKVDFSIPAVRDLVIEFSSTIKKLRDKAKKLSAQNKELEASKLHLRSATLAIIMRDCKLDYNEAESYLKAQVEHLFPQYKRQNLDTINHV